MMPFRVMLDSDVISDIMRNPEGRVAHELEMLGPSLACISIVVAAELRFGAEKVGSERARRWVEQAIAATAVMPFEEPADRIYAQLRQHLKAIGKPIGGNDLFIAAHALALDLTLVTVNTSEFLRVPGLRVENWLAD